MILPSLPLSSMTSSSLDQLYRAYLAEGYPPELAQELSLTLFKKLHSLP